MTNPQDILDRCIARSCAQTLERPAQQPAGDGDDMQSEYEKHAIEGRRLLTAALEQFKKAKAQRTIERTRLAISSAKGAVRAAGYRAQRQTEKAGASNCRPTNL